MGSQLYVWGSNNYGGIGDDSVAWKSSPVQTVAGGSNWADAAFGLYHSAAVKTDGTLWCWGQNYYGELGDNTIIDRSSPVQIITGGTNWSQVSCGTNFTAAIKKDGTLWMWGGGFNNAGQLGDNTIIHRSSPVQTAAGGSDWSLVSCGYKNTAAIKTDGTLWVWGWNANGQLGDNTTSNVSYPIQTVDGDTTWSKVSVGYSFCGAIKTDGTLWTWGANYQGQLGDETTISKSSPIQTITGGTTWSEISIISSEIAAIKTDGTLWTWGANYQGQLGDNTAGPGTYKSSPVQTIAYGTNWSKVSTGFGIKVGLKKDGTLWTWGDNNYGQLGDNSQGINKSSPVQVYGASTSWSAVASRVSITAGALQSFAPVATKISVATNTSTIYNSQKFGTQPIIVNLLDSSDVLVSTATNSVTISVVSGSLTLGGTTTAAASGGVVAFTNLNLSGVGNTSLLFTASGLTSAIAGPLNVKSPMALMPKRSETASSVPTSGQLLVGEFAINIADKKGYVKKSDGTIVEVFTGLASGSITSGFVGNAAILSGNIGSGQIGFYHLASGTGGSSLSSGIVTSGYIGDNSVVSGSIGSGQIGFVHLASGTISTAALGSGQVTSGNIASGSVGQFELSSGAVNSGHIGDSAVVTDSIASGQITGSKIADFTITNSNLLDSIITIAGSSTALGGSWAAAALNTASGLTGGPYYPSGSLTIGIATAGVVSGMIASGQVGLVHLASGTISTATLGSGQVTSGNIASGSVGQFHHASGSVTSGHIGNNAVVSGSIASGSIGTFHISSGSITTNLIASGTIASEDLADNIIVSGKVVSGSISWLNLSSGAVRSGHVGDAAVVSGSIASGQIGWSAHASGSVRSGHIGDGAVVSGSVASGQIGINHLASGVISTAILGSGQVTSGSIASGSVGQFALSSGAVNSGHIGNNAVVSGSIASGQVGNFHIASGAVTSGDIGNAAVVSGSIASGSIGNIHISSGTSVSQTEVYSDASSGATRYITFASTLSGTSSTFVNSGLAYLPSSGLFGIGRTSPSANLHIAGGTIAGSGFFSNNVTLDQPLLLLSPQQNSYFVATSGVMNAMQISMGSRNRGAFYGVGIYIGGYGDTSTSYASRIAHYQDLQNTTGSRLALQSHTPGSGLQWNAGIKIYETGSVTIGYDADPVTAYGSNGDLFLAGGLGVGVTALSARAHIEASSASNIPLLVKGFTSQTANLQEWQNSAGSVYARINASGEFFGLLSSGIVTSGAIASGQIGAFHLASGVGGGSAAGASGMLQYNFGNAFGPTSGLRYSVTSGTPLVQATSQTAFNANFALKASSGQVSNLSEWKNTSGSNLAYMDVSGNFFAVSKSFLIDHPTKPGKKLRHVSLEGPTADVFVRGKTKEKVINLPEYWIGLVDYENINVILTPIGKDQTLYVDKIEGNKVYIDGNAFPNYYYMIIAERADIEKIVVEE